MKKIVLFLLVLINLFACESGKHKVDNMEFVLDLTQHNWQFKEFNKEEWMPATVPGTVHTDLLALDSIEDPFYRLNEKSQQWIDKTDWEYTTEFLVDGTTLGNELVELTLEGIDTYADVYLNEKLILQTDNMFRTYKVDVTEPIIPGVNDLHIIFYSPTKKGLELLAQHGYALPAVNDQSENGEMGSDKVSPFVRKAPYHFGWDWGPRLVTSGIWKPIYLTFWSKARIIDVFVNQVNITKEKAEIQIQTEFVSEKYLNLNYKIVEVEHNRVLDENNLDLAPGESMLTSNITIDKPDLWWPNGYGKQNLYTFRVDIFNGQEKLASKEVKTGLRNIKVIREPDAKGKSFYFEVNGIPVFAKGANYIPNDNFTTRVPNEKYAHILQSAADANMNMLRVWGGGIYEYDTFYNMCDSLGLMLWQDFMFACSMYPGKDEFIETVRLEAIDNVKRLRNHPSIALWCGNNEIETAWGEGNENSGWGWKQLYNADQRKDIYHAYDTLFYSVLPEVVAEYNSNVFYWPSSPAAGFRELAGYDNASGDMHYWGVWHGLDKFERFNEVIPRFMSEYGFQSFPDFASVKKYTKEEDWDIESEVMASHQRSGIGNLRIKEYMGWDYNIPNDFEQFLYVGQILQAEGMKVGIEAHRRNKPYCMGTLYWQINDCWPVASWSSIDYYGKWKALHYFVKKAYEPYLISMIAQNKKIEIWVISDKIEDIRGKLELHLLSFDGKEIYNKTHDLYLKANASVDAINIDISELKTKGKSDNMVLLAEFKKDNNLLASQHFYFEKTKKLNLKQEKPVLVLNNGKLEVSASSLIKNLYLYTDDEAVFSDNYFDVLPGVNYSIEIKSKSSTVEIEDIKYISIADTYNTLK